MDKTVKKLLTGGQKLDFSLRMDLDGEFVVIKQKTLFALKGNSSGKKFVFYAFI